MQKKGELTTEELIKIIFAVIGILILIPFGIKIANILTYKYELKQAEESLNKIVFSIEKAEKLEEDAEVFVHSPREWWIIAWPYKDFKYNGQSKPLSCKGEYCVCICPIPSFSSKESSFLECESRGICRESDKLVKTIYDAPPSTFGAKVWKKIAIWRGKDVKNIPLNIGSLLNLKISLKEKDQIQIIRIN